MYIPKDVENLILDFVFSMEMFEKKQRMHAELNKNTVVQHMKSFHVTTLVNDVFCYRFCLAVLKYMNTNGMII